MVTATAAYALVLEAVDPNVLTLYGVLDALRDATNGGFEPASVEARVLRILCASQAGVGIAAIGLAK
ncbi:hypothetical protein GCM10009304_40110 [Pseudomonas matsuisoli]|uniref:Uncharacterized protein n=1 Tax=Pseudomonas matsuisoli TaxID=1515666 RepID=A0A917Q309_9PSED|nr:hypothetical protein GCM10009304_40110 [Pseudomonas matsuisoli]